MVKLCVYAYKTKQTPEDFQIVYFLFCTLLQPDVYKHKRRIKFVCGVMRRGGGGGGGGGGCVESWAIALRFIKIYSLIEVVGINEMHVMNLIQYSVELNRWILKCIDKNLILRLSKIWDDLKKKQR